MIVKGILFSIKATIKLKKYKRILLIIASFFLLSYDSACQAEKIYYKDGRVVDKQILCRNRGAIWFKHPMGATGINVEDIDRIENDDGSISRYDHKAISKRIEDFIRLKKYAEAVKWCDFLLSSYAYNAEVRYLRATLNQKIGNNSSAREDYEFLIDNKKANAEIYNNLGAIYVQEKKYDEAEAYFTKAVNQDPGLMEARNNLAALAKKRKESQ